ncbi:MAG: BatD family protein [Candidatus Marinimicrobia bacterium]|nr:BatD family protein [Candidatus Neomarinimicrobiota bacterium]
MKKLSISLILLITFLIGAEPKVSSSVDTKQLFIQDSFTWTIEVEGSDEMPQIRLPDIEKIALLSGPMQSSNYTYINGEMSSKKTLTYTFVALEPGKVTIPSVEVYLGRKSYRTNTVSLEILRRGDTPVDQEQPEQSVFIKAIPSKNSLYIGEPVSVHYKLFTKVGVYNYKVEKLPDAVGFWSEEISQSSQPRLVSEIVNGIRYNTAVLKTVLYYPTRAGDLVIDPLITELEIEVKSTQRNRRSMFNDPFFNDPFFSGTRKATRNFGSNPVEIKVKQLPEPRPENFSGAVGRFRLKATLDTNAVMVNDAVGLNITVSGSGNFGSLILPEIITPEGVDVFKPERSESVSIKNMTHQGSKTVTYLLVPRTSGRIDFQTVKFSYFDLDARKYVTRNSGPIQLMVYDASGSQPLVTSGYSREEVALMREDIRYIKAAETEFTSSREKVFNGGFWSIHFLGILLVGGLLGFQYRSRQLEGNENLRRSSKAMRTAREKLKQAKHLSDDSHELRTLLHQCIAGFIGDRLNAPENALDTTELVGLLRTKKISGEIVAETRHFLEGLIMDRFAPGAVRKEAGEWIKQTESLLQQLRKVL